MDIKEIVKTLPHRYPFLLIDRVLELEPGQRGIAIKNVTINEPFFQGHFPGDPVMPGVLIMEALAQLGGVVILSCEEHRGKLAFLTGMDSVRFRKRVVPGDQLRLEAEIIRMRGVMGKGEVKAFVGDEIAAQGQIMFALSK